MKNHQFPSFSTFNVEPFLAHWTKFYQEVHGVTFDPSRVLLPPVEQALDAGGVMIPGITIERDLAQIKKMTKGNLPHRYKDMAIDELIQRDKEAPRPAGPYALWTVPAVEAVQQAPHLAEKSYNDVVEMNLLSQVMNYAEYVRFFCWYLWATGEPLDIENWILTGSLDADDGVLYSGWCDEGLYVDWCHRDHSSDGFRFRQVVLPPLS